MTLSGSTPFRSAPRPPGLSLVRSMPDFAMLGNRVDAVQISITKDQSTKTVAGTKIFENIILFQVIKPDKPNIINNPNKDFSDRI